MKAVIIIPTYNEKANIARMMDALLLVFKDITKHLQLEMHLLIVDDSSPDGTGEIVTQYTKEYSAIHLLKGKKQGLGRAYLRGFSYAIKQMKADVVMEMDADFSHNPIDVARLLIPIAKDKADFVIGSRYIRGGSIPSNWGRLRKLNSRFGNLFARYVAGISGVKDCTAGFRAIRVDLLKKAHYEDLDVDGYSFQMNLLYAVIKAHARIKEVPVHFIDREFGESKIRFTDIYEFMQNAVKLRFSFSG